jgi:hypothetical protein
MTRKAVAGALALALLTSAAGCNATKVAGDINTLNAALTSPAAQQAVANARALGMTAACLISGAAAKAQALNAALAPLVSARQAKLVTRLSNGAAIVGVVNAALCADLGGSVAAQ